MSHYESGSNDRVEWSRWAKVLAFTAAVLALVAAVHAPDATRVAPLSQQAPIHPGGRSYAGPPPPVVTEARG